MHTRRSTWRGLFFLLALMVTSTWWGATAIAASTTLVINEIDYDQPSTDTAEFIELKNVSGAPLDLAGYEVELINGSGGGAVLYQTIVLPAVTLAADDYFVICANAATVANCDLDVSPDTNLVQNGAPDAVGLRFGGTLVDAVSYEGDTGAPYTEGSGVGLEDDPGPADMGISRCPDGVDTDQNNVDFMFTAITPGAANACAPTAADLVINEIDYDQPGTDAAEFVEIRNNGSTDVNLDLYSIELVNGSGGGAVVYQTIDLPAATLAAGGYYVVCGDAANVPNCDLDVSPDTNLIQNGAPDAVALLFDGSLIDTVSYEGDTGAPYTEGSGAGLEDNSGFDDHGISRCPDGVDTDQNNVDFIFTASTPGAANACAIGAGDLVINEIDYDQPGTDAAEFVEIKNNGGSDVNLDLYSIELVNGSGGGAVVYQTIDLPSVTLAAGGHYVVCGDAANVANCDLDVSPDTNLIQNGAPDAVALLFDGNIIDTVSYEGDTGAPYTEGSGAGLEDDPGFDDHGISRCPDGADSDQNNVDFQFRPSTPGAVNDCPPPPITVRIRDIQGAAHISPMNGLSVSNVPGIVTAVASNGFYFQDPDPDSDNATSEGLFVFTSSAPTVAVGDDVRVAGVVTEFRPGGISTGNLTITEITSPVVTIFSSGNPLPPPVIIGLGGRIPPGEVINDDGDGNVENQPPATFDADTDGIDFYESLEGMLVQVNDGLVVGPTNRFNETWVLGDNGANATGTFSPRGSILISPTDFNPERIQLDDGLYPGAWPMLDVGAQLTSPAIGVVSYSFGNFEVLVTELYTTDSSGAVTRETTTLVGDDDHLTVATFNVENLGGNADPAAFDSRADLIVNHLLSPDILVLEEIQDNNGTTNDGTVDATVTYNNLIAAIQAAGGPTYLFRQIDPLDGQDGGVPGGNIRVGFLYNPARVSFVDRPGGDATTANVVNCTGGAPELAYNPGRVDPNNTAFVDSRKPLAGEFMFNGNVVFVVGVHFSSKGGDTPLFGFNQPPILHTEAQRIAQAAAVNGFANDILSCAADANVIVIGDTNDFQFSPPIATLKGSILHNLMDLLPPEEQYSYIFQGNGQVLDQGVVSNNLLTTGAAEYDVVHVNAEFSSQVSDHEPSIARFFLEVPNAPPVCDGAYPSQSVLWPPEHQFVDIHVLGVTDPDGDPVTIVIDAIFQDEPVDGDGSGKTAPDGRGVGTDTAGVRAERSGKGNGRFYHIFFTASDGQGGSCSGVVQVVVPLSNGRPEPIDDGPLYDSTAVPPGLARE